MPKITPIVYKSSKIKMAGTLRGSFKGISFSNVDDFKLSDTNIRELGLFIESARDYLKKRIIVPLENVIDKAVRNAQSLQPFAPENVPAYFLDVCPSKFIKKMYTFQEWDLSGKLIENREQLYINTGTELNKNDGPGQLTGESKLFYEIGGLICAAHNMISQLNRIENAINQKKKQDIPFHVLALLPVTKDLQCELARYPDLINSMSFAAEIYDYLENLIDQFINWLKNAISPSAPLQTETKQDENIASPNAQVKPDIR